MGIFIGKVPDVIFRAQGDGHSCFEFKAFLCPIRGAAFQETDIGMGPKAFGIGGREPCVLFTV